MIKSALWIGPWIAGSVIIGALGRYGEGSHSVLPNWYDMLVVIAFSLVIFYWAIKLTMPESKVQTTIAKDSDQIEFVAT